MSGDEIRRWICFNWGENYMKTYPFNPFYVGMVGGMWMGRLGLL